MTNIKDWQKKRYYSESDLELAKKVLNEVREGSNVLDALRKNPLPEGRGFLAKHALVAVYRRLINTGELNADELLLAKIRMKPIRTLSGVTTITVLTKPSPCPGECIFCPTEENMPQSYLSDEPGARRGLENEFDPYRQVTSRLSALYEVGHPTEKVELLILGGSWSAYSRDYQEWFIKRCFDALNEIGPSEVANYSLEEAHRINVSSRHKNVGLVIETRPDLIDLDELIWYRQLGVTKVQLGVQSLNDHILHLNKRGHTYQQTLESVNLLRAGGFKIVLHWMPNLLGATLESDKADFKHLWEKGGLNPDELKIYPCQLLENSDLFKIWKRGDYQPYTEEQLISLIADLKTMVPRYCRINRVIRDIPSTHVVAGNRNTSLRQNVAKELLKRGFHCECIRCREIRQQAVLPDALELNDMIYHSGGAIEHFISFDTKDDFLVGYCRLSLPNGNCSLGLEELNGSALIRELHVYGQSIEVGVEQQGAAQHVGLGSRLLIEAEKIAYSMGFKKLAIIAAVGTRAYYQARGYQLGSHYMVKDLSF